MAGIFDGTEYQIKHQLSLIKEKFKIMDPSGTVLMSVSTPMMTLKKAFNVFDDEDGKNEVLKIEQHSLMQLHQTYDVTDTTNGQLLGQIQYEAMKSFMGSKWKILDTKGEQIAEVAESTQERLGNDFLAHGLIPRVYTVTGSDTTLATYAQEFQSLILNFTMDFSADTENKLDRRMGIAAGIVAAGKALEESRGGEKTGLDAIV
jgi:hypothetical protein